jgi:hypothetical protein
MVNTQRCWLLLVSSMLSVPAFAQQQVTVTTPLVGINDSFYEHFNIHWGLQRSWPGGSWFMNFGGPNSVIPPFGGYDPNNDFRFGVATRGSGFSGFFGLSASQGSNRTMTMVAPSVTMMNGVPGQVFSGSIRPFVTGLIPVVGDYPVVPYAPYPQFIAPGQPVVTSPLAERLERLRAEPPPAKRTEPNAADALVLGGAAEGSAPVAVRGGSSSAERGDISVAEIRRKQALEDEEKQRELAQLIEEAQAAEKAGQLGVARVRYRQAALRATGDQRRQLLETVAKLTPPR